MLNLTLAMARKDLSVTLTRSAGLVQALLLGLLLIFMFSLSRKAGDTVSPQTAATIFWLASSFCQVLIFNTLYSSTLSSQFIQLLKFFILFCCCHKFNPPRGCGSGKGSPGLF